MRARQRQARQRRVRRAPPRGSSRRSRAHDSKTMQARSTGRSETARAHAARPISFAPSSKYRRDESRLEARDPTAWNVASPYDCVRVAVSEPSKRATSRGERVARSAAREEEPAPQEGLGREEERVLTETPWSRLTASIGWSTSDLYPSSPVSGNAPFRRIRLLCLPYSRVYRTKEKS
jgi:hypothetical protein